MNETAWYRVPQWIGGRLTGDHVATDAEAWVDLLGRWHQGEDVSACAFQKATGWGKGRVLAFMPKVANWAVETGASLPKAWSDRLPDRPSDRKRTDIRTDENKGVPALSGSNGPETDRASDRKRTASCARDPFKRSEEIEIRSEGGGEAPPPKPEQGVQEVGFGPKSHRQGPSPEPESELLPLLVNAGLNLGAASGVIQALRGASIMVVGDALPLDEWDLGRIVGTSRKVATIKAFRAGGWMPPKERNGLDDGSDGGIPLDRLMKMKAESDQRRKEAEENKQNGIRAMYQPRGKQNSPSLAKNGQGMAGSGSSGMDGSSDDWIDGIPI